MTALGDAAVVYAGRGWAVFPVKACGKTPLTAHGCKDATTDAATVTAWWSRWPQANVGIATGAASGLVAIDLDVPDGGETFMELQRRHGPAGSPLWARTGSGGWHALYAHPGVDIPNSAGRLGSGVDIRGDGGYIVAAPSVHPSGGRYRWHDEPSDPGPMTAWLVRLARPPARRPVRPVRLAGDVSRYAAAALEAEAAAVAAAVDGTRNHTLNRAAFNLGTLVGTGQLNSEDVAGVLVDAALAAGLSAGEASRTVASGLDAGTAHPRKVAS